MKTNLIIALLVLQYACALGQGTLVFDQQATIGTGFQGLSFIQNQQPMGQSFTPSLSAVGFVQLRFFDTAGSLGSTVSVSLLENSITGNVVAASSPVFMPNGFIGITNFFFNSNISVQSGVEYFLLPVHQSGDNTSLLSDVYNYSGGTAFFLGAPSTSGLDFWFREGIVVVPEPAACLLFVVSVVTALFSRRKRT